MTGAIHQPNFFAWLGYFHKICLVENFIFFDNVPISNGKTWTSRCQICTHAGEAQWLRVPIRRGEQLPISQVEMVDFQNFSKKMLRTLQVNYRKSAHFDEVFEVLEFVLSQNFILLADLNIFFIETIIQKLGFEDIKFHRASQKMGFQREAKTDLIVETCQAFNINNYVAGKGGSLTFLEIEKFEAQKIQLEFQNFVPPQYKINFSPNFREKNEHQNDKYLEFNFSIIHVLMNLGFQETRQLLLKS
ncbi:MAG: hypothetical protein RL757_1191 [Bacteroidota bacterium]|jgi:hypothetical protein